MAVLTSCEKSESFLLMQILFRAGPHQQQTPDDDCCSAEARFESKALGETETPQPKFNDFIPSLLLHSLVVVSSDGETRILAGFRDCPNDVNPHLDRHVCCESMDLG